MAGVQVVSGGVGMAVSRLVLWLARKAIALDTAYAAWTGIGAVGTFLIGVRFFSDATSLGSYDSVTLIISGVAVLKLSR
jgi:quaternary ammonium compound-resistance protein SugE